MGVNFFLSVLVSLCSFAAAAQNFPARVNCLDSQLGSSTITTLRSDVRFEYLAPSLKITYANDQSFSALQSLITLSGNNLSTQLLFLGKDQKSNWGLYFSDAKITLRAGKAVLLAEAAEPGTLVAILEGRHLSSMSLAVDKSQTLVIFPAKGSKTYSILDRSKGNAINPLAIAVNSAANPRFSPDSKFVIFDVLNSQTNLIQQVLVDVATQKQTVIASKEAHNLDLHVANNNMFWIALTEKNMGRDKIWTLKSAPLQNPSLSADVVATLSTEKDLVPPFAWIEDKGNLSLAFVEERFERDSSTGDFLLKKGQLKLYKLDTKKSTALPFEAYPYSAMVTQFAQKFAEFGGGLQFAQYHPGSNTIIFSGGIKSGLVTFDLTTKNWALHGAAVDLSKCFQPAIGNEVQ